MSYFLISKPLNATYLQAYNVVQRLLRNVNLHLSSRLS